jgi:hypothetical protein
VCIIYIEDTKGNIYECIIDTLDFDIVNKWHGSWCITKSGNGYIAVRNTRQQILSRLIMGNPYGLIVDHLDSNTLNNRRSNLRIATKSQNNFNLNGAKSSNQLGIRGVYKRSNGTYGTFVRFNNKVYLRKTYKTLLEAVMNVKAIQNQLNNAPVRVPILLSGLN